MAICEMLIRYCNEFGGKHVGSKLISRVRDVFRWNIQLIYVI